MDIDLFIYFVEVIVSGQGDYIDIEVFVVELEILYCEINFILLFNVGDFSIKK